jgi:NitT/TauT family transport system permease protein
VERRRSGRRGQYPGVERRREGWRPGKLGRYAGVAALIAAWWVGIAASKTTILPTPWAVILAIGELIRRGLLIRYIVASLFRVTWGYLGGVLVGVPLGLVLGWWGRGEKALNPLLQVMRPISPLAWIPIAILWFGVGDPPAIFIIFLGTLFPMTVSALNAVGNVSATHVNVGRNFGLPPMQILRRIVFPAVLPQLIVGLRLGLGVAWLVVVAAEMIAVNSGLGFLILDARNAGNRYDLVVAGMVLVGVIGFVIDVGMRRLERLKTLRWGALNAAAQTSGH